MAFSIESFKQQLALGGARTSLFEVQVTNLVYPGADNKFTFMCKASEIPEARLSTIEVPYFGRKIKVAGHKTYADWSTTIINDEDFAIRGAIEDWQSAINQPEENTPLSPVNGTPLSYKSTALITQYGKNQDIIAKYKMIGLFPTLVAAIPLDWNQPDSIQEFQVTFTYDYYVREQPGAGAQVTFTGVV